jgi:nucleoside-diphosphate-sugar epimerase
MKVKATGLSGFIGKELSIYLSNNFIDISKIERKNIYNNKFFIEKCDCVIHLAGKAHDTKKYTSLGDYQESNFNLTKLLFEKFLTSKSKTFIYLSSIKVVDDEIKEVITENSKLNPKTSYGLSKLNAEKYLLDRINNKTNKTIIILRPTLVIGKNNKGNLEILSKYLSYGIPWPLGKYNNKRSLCSIFNLCYVIKKIIEADKINSGVYNVCDDYPIKIKDLVKEISTTLNKKSKIINVPKFIINVIANLGDFISLKFNSESLRKISEDLIVSNEKLKSALKLKKLPYNSIDIFKPL